MPAEEEDPQALDHEQREGVRDAECGGEKLGVPDVWDPCGTQRLLVDGRGDDSVDLARPRDLASSLDIRGGGFPSSRCHRSRRYSIGARDGHIDELTVLGHTQPKRLRASPQHMHAADEPHIVLPERWRPQGLEADLGTDASGFPHGDSDPSQNRTNLPSYLQGLRHRRAKGPAQTTRWEVTSLNEAEILRRTLEQSAEAKRAAIKPLSAPFEAACRAIGDRLQAGGTLFTCGNGGSMCDAMHLVGEMIGRFAYDRLAIRAVTLGANPASVTAIANDYSYVDVLLREADALIAPGDALIGISTSGGAQNITAVARLARERGAFVVGLTGRSGGILAAECDVELRAPSDATPRIQEVHITLIHALCEALEARLRPPTA